VGRDKPKKSESVGQTFLILILVAILKIFKTKSTTLSDDLFLCQLSKGSAVRFEFNIFCTLVSMATPFWFGMVAILNQKWPPKYKNPPIWAKFGFQVDYEVAN
jgi:hypothetical protein